MKALKCPSRGGELAIRDGVAIAFCMYCGQKILLDETDSALGRKKVARYEELCATALAVHNYADPARYAEHMVELDPRNASAWIFKAHATLGLFADDERRPEETKQYLRKAAQIALEDARIHEALRF